jgi:hypothetical protein
VVALFAVELHVGELEQLVTALQCPPFHPPTGSIDSHQTASQSISSISTLKTNKNGNQE